MIPGLEFDKELHVYKLDGVVIPSCTQLIKPLIDYSHVPDEVLERKRQIGSALHTAIELYHEGTLDESTIDPAVQGYFDGWLRWELDHGTGADYAMRVLGFEVPTASRLYRFGCTPDFWGWLGRRPAVVDIKTTAAAHPAVGLQTVAQAIALCEAGAWGEPVTWEKVERYALRLDGRGSYRVHRYSEPDDYGTFLALRTLFGWRQRHRI